MLLVSICLMGRASCMTTYCPTVENIRLPAKKKWDKDGLPHYIELGMMCV